MTQGRGRQWVFYLFFVGLYLVSPKAAHRVVGDFEEEAVISYTHYFTEIDEGRSQNVAADEARHRDVNHGFANELAGLVEPVKLSAVWPHEQLQPHWADAA